MAELKLIDVKKLF